MMLTPKLQFNDMGKMQWVVEGVLARSSRPSYWDDATPEIVDQWLNEALRFKIKTIICLLSYEELQEYYIAHGIDLIQQYLSRGLDVFHVPIADYQEPPLNNEQIVELFRVFSIATRPLLVHCSAGIDRTGDAVKYLQPKAG
jgi:protein tyrosine/serine phosphatase